MHDGRQFLRGGVLLARALAAEHLGCVFVWVARTVVDVHGNHRRAQRVASAWCVVQLSQDRGAHWRYDGCG